MPEFATYSESLILDENQLDVLENDSKLSEENEFILNMLVLNIFSRDT